jgi:hypothetical protein
MEQMVTTATTIYHEKVQVELAGTSATNLCTIFMNMYELSDLYFCLLVPMMAPAT